MATVVVGRPLLKLVNHQAANGNVAAFGANFQLEISNFQFISIGVRDKRRKMKNNDAHLFVVGLGYLMPGGSGSLVRFVCFVISGRREKRVANGRL